MIKHKITVMIVSLLLILFTFSITQADQAKEDGKLQQVAEDYFDLICKFDPVYATEIGVHTYDALYPDFSKRKIGSQVSSLKNIRNHLLKIKKDQLLIDRQVDYQLLNGNINTQILLNKSKFYQDNPKLYSATAINGIYLILISPTSDSVKLETILKRLADFPRFLKSAKKNLSNPPDLWLRLAEEEAENGIVLFNSVAEYFSEKFPSKSAEINSTFSQAVNSLEEFVDLLDALKIQVGKSFAFGKSNFDKLLKYSHFLDYDSDSLLRLGENLYETYVIKYDSLKDIVDNLPPIDEDKVFIPASFNRQDVLDYFQWEINQSREWTKYSGFASVPDYVGLCQPQETPVFLRNIISSIAYMPVGPFEDQCTGIFYIRPLADTLDQSDLSAYFRYAINHGFKSSTVHEAYPGHHLQLQIASHHPSLIRKLQMNNLMVEGWALYCEEEVYHHGYYKDDPRKYLSIVGGIVFRAARIIIDVKLHTGQITYQDAVNWMVKNLGSSVGYIESEVNRYTLSPTQPMSYLVGKMLIKDLRESYQNIHGDEFNIKTFHDELLSEGSISPVLIKKKLSGQIF